MTTIQCLCRCLGWQFALLCSGGCLASAQPVDALSAAAYATEAKGDTLHTFNNVLPDKRGSATLKMLGANGIPFVFNRYIRKEPFAYVTWQSLRNNLRLRSWKWDEDNFINNQFSHPYHGSLYFNSFRSGGFGFWQSVPAVFAGSLVWEIAAEMETPAINDLVNTTLGGIAWGEVTHRLANKFIQAGRLAKKRKALRLLGQLVDPMNTFSSWVDPEKRKLRSGMDTTPVQFELSGGSRQYNQAFNGRRQWPKGEWFTRLGLQYGGDAESLKTPFSRFMVMVELGTSDSSLFNIAQIRGNLAGWKLSQNQRHYHYLALNLDYDYYRNTAFRYGMQSFQWGLFSNYSLRSCVALQTELSTFLIGLAAVSDNQPYPGRRRDYDYGSGAGVAAALNLLLFERFGFRTNNRLGWLQTLDGKLTNYRLINSTSAVFFRMKQRFILMYEWGHFYLKSRVDKAASEVSHNYYKRVAVGYRFTL